MEDYKVSELVFTKIQLVEHKIKNVQLLSELRKEQIKKLELLIEQDKSELDKLLSEKNQCVIDVVSEVTAGGYRLLGNELSEDGTIRREKIMEE